MKPKKQIIDNISSVQETQAKVKEYESKYLRALADYQNLEKRVEQTIINAQVNIQKELLFKFLNILDDIEKAEVFVKDEGLQMIKKHMLSIFEEYGIKEIQLEGKIFDPLFAEAVGVVADDNDNLIVHVQKKGYMMHDKVLRHAQVIVGKKQM